MKPFTERERKLLFEFHGSKTIGVLMGGPSEERDISLKSGAAVLTHLSCAEYRVEPCDFYSEGELRAQLKKKGIALAFLALHGKFGEDGKVQEILESLGIPYTGSSPFAGRRAFNKALSGEIFRKHGLVTPEGCCVALSEPVPQKKFTYPLVVKPVCQGSSLGLSIVDSEETLPAALLHAFRYDTQILIEPYIRGSELTVGILGEEALPIIQILPDGRFYDYEAKYESSKTQFLIPAPLSDAVTAMVQEAALRAHAALGCDGFSRVDLLLNDRCEPVILEVNTIPGLTARSLLPRACEAVGISFLELCERMLVMALTKKFQRTHAEKSLEP